MIKIYSSGRYFTNYNGMKSLSVVDDFGNLIAVY